MEIDKYYTVGIYDDEEIVLGAVKKLRAEGVKIFDKEEGEFVPLNYDRDITIKNQLMLTMWLVKENFMPSRSEVKEKELTTG